jgi:hypothetical protein
MHEYDSTAMPREWETEYGPPVGGVFNEAQEAQLAEQLLELESEQEFEQFLGDLFKKVGGAIGGFIKSPVGQALGGVLKNVAGKLLPMAGQALGGMLGPAGGQIGSQLASAAGSAFGLSEVEVGEQEFEAAQTFVRLASDAIKNAAQAPPNANPHAVAQQAVAQAAQVHAPGLLSALGHPGGPPAPQPGPPKGQGWQGKPERHHSCGCSEGEHEHHHHCRSGHWERHGHKIVLYGA